MLDGNKGKLGRKERREKGGGEEEEERRRKGEKERRRGGGEAHNRGLDEELISSAESSKVSSLRDRWQHFSSASSPPTASPFVSTEKTLACWH